ncbi:MAG: NADH-quinone oxidoreductase subunit C [Alphaproteobacteria bacterium]|nr:NADH-quinone oxidoreductase subunit C [Alphaproteobacteria bacterium]
MPKLAELVATGRRVETHQPWPRVVVEEDLWLLSAALLAAGHVTLLGLWGDREAVHMALLDSSQKQIFVVTKPCPDGAYPSVGQFHPPAIRLERTVRDLFGLDPIGLPDMRPWLDHGQWGCHHPLSLAAEPQKDQEAQTSQETYEFLTAEGESLHQIAVGPVHAGIIEPGHFRITANGETVVRLEERFGYTHKGVEKLMAGASIDEAAELAGRISGDSSVAYAYAFARAVEAAVRVAVPPRAVWLRALMAELERLANHLGDIGAICNDAAFAIMHAQCGILRERVLRTAQNCFGHRLMMDCIAPGGTSVDLLSSGFQEIRLLVRTINKAFPLLIELYDNTASLQDRTVGTGLARPALVKQYGCGGFIGRASARAFDARVQIGYPPYDTMLFNYDVPVLAEGDVNARIWIRMREVLQSLALIEQFLARLPVQGPVRVPIEGFGRGGEGLAVVEGFRGDVLAYLRLDGAGRIERCHLRDPSWFQWPVLEAAIENNIVADFPLCNKSFNCSYSGHDL